jgi:MFS superfamily sulfate permease-like transporter
MAGLILSEMAIACVTTQESYATLRYQDIHRLKDEQDENRELITQGFLVIKTNLFFSAEDGSEHHQHSPYQNNEA